MRVVFVQGSSDSAQLCWFGLSMKELLQDVEGSFDDGCAPCAEIAQTLLSPLLQARGEGRCHAALNELARPIDQSSCPFVAHADHQGLKEGPIGGVQPVSCLVPLLGAVHKLVVDCSSVRAVWARVCLRA